MLQRWYKAMPDHAVPGIDIVRLGVAVIILMHPLHGFYHYQDVAPGFGGYLGNRKLQ